MRAYGGGGKNAKSGECAAVSGQGAWLVKGQAPGEPGDAGFDGQ
jgi:hypothetical protein